MPRSASGKFRFDNLADERLLLVNDVISTCNGGQDKREMYDIPGRKEAYTLTLVYLMLTRVYWDVQVTRVYKLKQ